MQQRLPGGDVIGEAGDGLEFYGFKGCAGYLCLGGVLRGIEEAAEWDGDLLAEDEAELAGEVVLTADPGFVRGWTKVENRVAADGGRGEAGDERQQRLPLEGGVVGMFNRGRDGIEERHLVLSYRHLRRGGCSREARSGLAAVAAERSRTQHHCATSPSVRFSGFGRDH